MIAAVAAGISYALAGVIFGAQEAAFAPVAAVVATGLAAGQRRIRALEISVGVVLGVVIADLLSRWFGTGGWQLSLAVLFGMTLAVIFRPSGLMANQAAVAAVVVMVLIPHLDSGPWVRLGDAVLGVGVALLLTSVFDTNPYREATKIAERVLARYREVLELLSEALGRQSLAGAEAALNEMETLLGARGEIANAVAATRERISLRRAHARKEEQFRLKVVRQLGSRINMLLASGRSLCRAGANLVRHSGPVDQSLLDGLHELSSSIGELSSWMHNQSSQQLVRDKALTAARTVSKYYAEPHSPAVNVLVGQVRSNVVDVLRITGLSQSEAVSALEGVAGRADRFGNHRFSAGDSPEWPGSSD